MWGPPPGYPAAPFAYPVQLGPNGMMLATLGQRLVARVLDIFAVLLLNVLVNGYFAYQLWQEMAPLFRAAQQNPFGPQPQPTNRAEALFWTMLVVATLLWLAYEAPATGSRGQTLGKWLVQIKVVGVEGTEPIGFGRAFRRWARLGLWTPFWGCAGLGILMQLIDAASPLFDQRLRQAFHDRTARTVVVAVPPNHRQPVDSTSGNSTSGPSDRPAHHP
jgi:uncharacterized RDD family membrane protein YckC